MWDTTIYYIKLPVKFVKVVTVGMYQESKKVDWEFYFRLLIVRDSEAEHDWFRYLEELIIRWWN
jgi:hypothetical protein